MLLHSVFEERRTDRANINSKLKKNYYEKNVKAKIGVPVPVLLYWYWYWYLSLVYWYWYWYLLVEYLIQDCPMRRHSSHSAKAKTGVDTVLSLIHI